MDLCSEIAASRRDSGLSQQDLADKLAVPRLKIARMEVGNGSVELLLQLLPVIGLRFNNVARGDALNMQMKNARIKRGWTIADCARRAGTDARTVAAVENGKGTVASLMKILSAVAPQAARQPVTRAFWDYDRSKSAEADSRFTPEPFLESIVEAFGEIALDPCSHTLAPIKAKRKIILPEDGLEADWTTDGLVWINPPFSNLSPWLKKANDAWKNGSVRKMIFLLPASRLDLRSYFDEASRAGVTLILRERLRFESVEHPDGKHRAPFALSLVCWGCADHEIEMFRSKVPSLRYGPITAI